ncbi:MAG: acyltransferase [Gemmatimonadaceae bacterium]
MIVPGPELACALPGARASCRMAAPTQSHTTNPTSRPHSIPSLDGLRALSICLVLVTHVAGTRGAPIAESINQLFDWGALGVRVFFVISGYLITHLLLTEQTRTGAIELARFYLRRTLRIFPPYYVYLVTVLVLGAAGVIAPQPVSALVHAFTYTTNYARAMSWELGHSWSLSVEEQFYLLWPVALALCSRRRAWIVPALAVVLCPLFRVAEFHSAHSAWVDKSFETAADALASGCLLALFAPRLRQWRAYRALQDGVWFAAVPAVVLGALALGRHPHLSFLAGHAFANIGIALSVHWCIVHANGRVGRVLNSRPMTALGRVSYSLYLWQEIFLNRYGTAWVNSFPANLLLALTAAIASHYLVERPALRMRPRVERVVLGRARTDADRAAADERAQIINTART